MTKENKFSVVLIEPAIRQGEKSVLRSYSPLVLEVKLAVSGEFSDPVVSWGFKTPDADAQVRSHMESICAEYPSSLDLKVIDTEVMGTHKIKVCHRNPEGMKDAEVRKASYLPYAHWEGDTIPVHLWACSAFKSCTLKWGEVEVKVTPTEALGMYNSINWEESNANPYLMVEGKISDLLFEKSEKMGVHIAKSSDYLKGVSSLKLQSIRKSLRDKSDLDASLQNPKLTNLRECAEVLREILSVLQIEAILELNDTISSMVYSMAENCSELVDTKGRSWSSDKVEEFISECEQALNYLGGDTPQDKVYGLNKLLSCAAQYSGEKVNKFAISDKEMKLMLAQVGMYQINKDLVRDLEDIDLDVEKMQKIKEFLVS